MARRTLRCLRRFTRSWPHLAAAAWILSLPLAAQAASYGYLDQKAPYANAVPTMFTARNLPKLGTTFQVEVANSWDPLRWASGQLIMLGAYHHLAFGLRNPDAPIGALGGFLFSSAEIVLPAPWNRKQAFGTVTMAFPIPNAPQLLGVRFYQQVLRTWFNDRPWRISAHNLSRGGIGVIGT